MRIVILLVVFAVVFSSLGLWLTAYGNTTSKERDMNYGISMATDKVSYSMGEPIIMILKIFNYTEEDIVFQFNSAPRYDFIIKVEEGNEIWRWSKDMMFAMVLGEETLGPTIPEIIYTLKYQGKLSSGYYKVTGILVAQNRPMSGSIIIEVK